LLHWGNILPVIEIGFLYTSVIWHRKYSLLFWSWTQTCGHSNCRCKATTCDDDVQQGSPNYGPRRQFIRPAKPFG